MSAFYDLNKTPRNILNQAIVRAIVSENNGALFDPSDLSTLFQDAAGTIPVTAVEQPVGLMLDKSGNGYHATQSITASRPTLSARYNLLMKTEDFSETSVWQGNGINIASNVYKTPFSPELLADKITIQTSSGVAHFVYHQPIQYVAGVPYTYTHHVAYAGYRYVQLTFPGTAFGASQYANFDLQSGVVTAQSGGTASIESTANGFFKISFSATATTTSSAGSALAYIDSPTSGRLPLLTGDGLSGYYLFGASLVIGASAGPYQRVNTATDYDTNPAYFPKYLRFDGVDDYLNLPWMNLAGSSAGTTTIVAIDSRPASADVSYVISEKTTYAPVTAYGPMYLAYGLSHRVFMMKDDLQLLDTGYAVQADRASVFSVTDDLVNITQRKNGAIMNQVLFTHPAMTTNITLIGAANHGGVLSSYLAGYIYSLIITKSALTDAQRIKCERYSASKAGVIL